jgi:hypothetical protein
VLFRSAGVVIGATLLAGLAGLVFVVALEKPVQARYVLPVTPLLYVCAAAGLRRGRTWWLLGSLGLMLGFGPFWLRYYSGYARADYSEITRRIATLERAQDTVLLTGPWQAWYFDYYYHGQLSHQVLPRDAPPALDPQEARVQLEALSQRYRRLWFVQAGLAQADPSNFVERWLQHHAWPAWRSVHQNAVLTHYALQAPRLTRPLRPVTFGGLVRLEGGWVDAEEVPAGDVVRLTLELSLLEDVPVGYKASLRLVGADGQRTAVDFELLDRTDEAERGTAEWDVGQRVTVRRGIWVPASLGPQPYSVRLVVYDPHTLSPLTPAQAGSEPPAGGPVVPGSELGGDSELGTRHSELRAQRGGEVAIADVYVTQSLAGLPPDAEAAYEPYGWRFGGGDAFDAFELVGARWVQGDPQAAPLAFDLLWRLDGLSGTEHRSTIAVVDERGVVWSEETRALFGGTFAIRDWRQRETLAERRLADLSALPPGRYRVVVALQDARGRTLPVEVSPVGTGAGGNQEGRGASPGAVELRRYELPYRRPLGERIAGLWQRLPLARLFVLGG